MDVEQDPQSESSPPEDEATEGASTAPPPSSSILFAGQDAMDEEDEDEALPPTSLSSMNANSGIANNINYTAQQTSKVGGGGPAGAGAGAGSRWSQQHQQQLQLQTAELLSTIITPSPYPHHLTGPTSSRFRNALGRITTRPTSDVEAWQALITEVNTCYRSLPNKHGMDADTQNKLDWMESCYGTLLKYFPYSSSHYVTIVEMLLAQSARVGEEDGPLTDYGFSLETSPRVLLCQAKLERILERVLGVTMDGTPSTIQTISLPTATAKTTTSPLTPDDGNDGGAGEGGEGMDLEGQGDESTTSSSSSSVIAGMCNSSVELWLLYIRTRSRQATRQALTMGNPTDGAQLVRDWTLAAYELAIEHAGFVVNNHLLWKQYLTYVKSWTPSSAGAGGGTTGGTTDHALAQKQMLRLRSIYQRLVAHPMTGLDQLWQDYEAFERTQSEALAQALLAEYSPKYQHARTVYLERNRVYSMVDLQLDSKFATPPVDPHDEREETSDTQEDIAAKMQEEQQFLTLWKKRIAYERTNPERLSAPALAQRVRQAFREMACVLTRHPEVWHMWSMWELHLGSGSGAAALEAEAEGSTTKKATTEEMTTTKESEKAHRAISVLALGLVHIPDCTLLAYAQAQIVELHMAHPAACLQVMERFLETTSNTLGFVLYQTMVRRYKGIAPARAVFARARRVLLESKTYQKQRNKGKEGDASGETAADGGAEDPEAEATGTGKEAAGSEAEENGKRWMVTNRLDPSIGTSGAMAPSAGAAAAARGATSNGTRPNDGLDDAAGGDDALQPKSKPGPITWHLYASHATMEHRLNQSPEVAARVYELGLRKHESFLTKPPYVMRYAQLLLELRDTVNLRALMTRAVTACEALAGGAGGLDGTTKLQQQQQHGANSSVAALWDMTLRFESLLSGADPTNVSAMEVVEKRRRAALLGPEVEDVTTGGIVGLGGDSVGIGAHKSTIAEQLIRSDGYDISSSIVNGMSRSMEVLEVMGLWGGGGTSTSSTSAMGAVASAQSNSRLRMQQLLSPKTSSSDGAGQDDEEMPGGKSDASYQRRLLFQCLLASGVSSEAAMADGGTGSKILLSARERLQQGGAASSGASGGNPQAPNTAVTMAIQLCPEWIRPMLLLLPASRTRTAVLGKPPPHLTEMALTSLRQNTLPAERPTDGRGDKTTLSGTKHRLDSSGAGGGGGGGGDSSDEENGGTSGGGGFGTQFRARQRERQMMAAGQQNGLGDGS